MYLIFDTETTGFPKRWNAPHTDTDNWPRLVQLAWQQHDAYGKLLAIHNYIVRPDGWTIPYNAEKVHGISTQRAQEEGIPLEEVLRIFAQSIAESELLIGHNVEFDLNVVGCEYVRTGIDNQLFQTASLCTKIQSTKFCALPGGKGGQYKWPTLSELHQKLFGEPFEEAHNASFDVEATTRCFFGLLQQEVIAARIPEGEEATGFLRKIAYEKPDLEAYLQESKAKRSTEENAQAILGKDAETLTEVLPFAHLHVHSQFTVLRSTAEINKLMAACKEKGMEAIALTDQGNMFAAFEALKAGHSHGVKVILGCELNLVEDRHDKQFSRDKKDRRWQHVLLAKNQTGYQNLSKICSYGWAEGMYGGFPRVDKALIAQYSEGLIAFSGVTEGNIGDALLNRGEAEAEANLRWWMETFGENFYLEVGRHGLPEEEKVLEFFAKYRDQFGLKWVASNNVYYIEKEDAQAHDALLCIKENEHLSTEIGFGRGKRYGFPNSEYYLKSPKEMTALFEEHPDALENTLRVAEQCEMLALEREVVFPTFPIPTGFDNDESQYLRHLTYEGAKQRYGQITPEIEERLENELKVIKDKGFPGYFLIVEDLIRAARQQGVSVGPGRGSAAGSAVAYCIGITNIDPIRYGLIFERFLNPERMSMPDIDIDFDDEGRQKVIDYTIETYGKEQVGQIITYGKMQPRLAIRDVGRVMEYPLPETDRLAKMVPEKPGTKFKDAFEQVPELKNLYQQDTIEGRLLQMAAKLEGSVRNLGLHAAGIIIAPDHLINYLPVATSKDSELWVTQFDKDASEEVGMLKMDYLGLKTLTIIKDAIELVARNRNESIDIDQVSLEDPKTFELYQKGDTVGTFQFESDGMRKHLRSLKPTGIEDLIAMNALYRPGPMQFIPNFIDRRHGREQVEYPHPLLEGILKETYGIMVYQEQIMQCAQTMAGYSPGAADLLRRAMGKKKMKIMDAEREKFVKGAKEIHQIPEEKANEVFDIMIKFAEYGFNKSHSAAYSLVAYQTAYLKANYPGEYMAAVLTHNMSNIDKITFFLEECRRMGLEVAGPDVNESLSNFNVTAGGKIRFGLSAIKGAGDAAVQAIVAEREANGPYQDVFDFAKRLGTQAINKKTLECLVLAGALDCFPQTHRAQYFHKAENARGNFIETLIRYAQAAQQENQNTQASLFGGDSGSAALPPPKVPQCPEWSQLEQLKKEKEVIGFYLSGHPLDQFQAELHYYCNANLSNFTEFKNQEVRIGAIIASVRKGQSQKSGKPFAIFTMEDYHATPEIGLFGQDYLNWSHMLEEGLFVYIKGKVEERFNNPGHWEIRPQSIKLLGNILEEYCKELRLSCEIAAIDDQLVDSLSQIAQKYPGQCALKLQVKDPEEALDVNLLSRSIRLQPQKALFQALEELPGVALKVG